MGGGAPLYSRSGDDWWTAYFESSYHYLMIHGQDEYLKLNVKTPEGTVIDELTILKEMVHAEFELDQTTGKMPLTVSFNAAGSIGNNLNYRWDFGDGEGGLGREVQHEFFFPGRYRITLTVNDGIYFDNYSDVVIVTNPYCFITAATSSACHETKLDVLRDFRDAYLLTNAMGTRLVEAYYQYSPVMTQCLVEHAWVRRIVRVLLSPLVAIASLVS